MLVSLSLHGTSWFVTLKRASFRLCRVAPIRRSVTELNQSSRTI